MVYTAAVFRDIIDLRTDQLTLQLPREFANRRIEVIVMPLDVLTDRPPAESQPGLHWPMGHLERLMGSVPDFPDSDMADLLDTTDAAGWDSSPLEEDTK